MIDKDSTLEQLIADAKTRGPTTEAEMATRRASFVRGDKAEMERLVQASEERVKRAFQ